MTLEEKQLLLTDLCARLPYGIKANIRYCDLQCDEKIKYRDIDITYFNIEQIANNWSECKPYLRPMSSMTEEEDARRCAFLDDIEGGVEDTVSNYIDWLNSRHFDYRGLIPMGLALAAPEGMYNN